MVKKILIGLLIFWMASPAYAQFKSNLKFKTSLIKDTIQLDTLSIIPKTIKVIAQQKVIDTASYEVDYAKSILVWKIKPTGFDSVFIQYQVFPILFSKKYSHKDLSLIREKTVSDNNLVYRVKTENNSIFSFGGIDKSGSISRSIGFGNNQNLSVNSNMVLQLSGKISNDIEILAAISDDNIPLQPEGNTQQLNDFDKVFIQLKRKNTTFIAGDYELKKPDSYFMNYYKRTQGAYISSLFRDKKKHSFYTQFAGAVAKGRSARNLFIGQEGNQGPYRLTGNNGEQFIIILSGTDRVYIDGQAMLRGQDNDYVIDYNTSEITFTTKRLITQNSRISVEFEYSDKLFARSLLYANQNYESKKLKIGFNFYNEQDNPNLPFLQNLSDTQKDYLKTIGNNINNAYFENAVAVAFNRNEILYKRVDTLNFKKVFVFSTDSLLSKFRVGFSYVGAGKGNYKIKDNATANGRVFEFIEPMNNLPQGDYEPITLLVTPKKQQLITLNTSYNVSKNTHIYTETGVSNQDANLFSTIDNEQNKGLAYKLIADNSKLLSGTDSSGLKLNTLFSYEFVNKKFRALERYRSVEFERDFNLVKQTKSTNEQWITGQIQLYQSTQKQILYRLSNFEQKNLYSGWQHTINSNYNYKNNLISYAVSLLNSNASTETGTFLRQYLKYQKLFKNFQTNFNAEQENNQTKDANQLLSPLSFAYKQYELVIQNKIQANNHFLFSYTKRFDQLPIETKLKDYSKANTFNFKSEFNKNPASILILNATYRTVNYSNADSLRQNEKTLIGRMDYTFKAFKGLINYNMFYELGTGQEPKREFTYLEVQAGQGVYAWNDYNNNGLKELNEFEISRFSDQAKFIRIFRSTNQFIRSNFTSINQNLNINGANLFRSSQNKLYTWVKKLNNITSLRIDQKAIASGNKIILNPYKSLINDVNLLSNALFFRSTLFYDKLNPVFGLDINHQENTSRVLLTNGFDDRSKKENSLRVRWNFIRKSNFTIQFKEGSKNYFSQLFTSNNYRISYIEGEPEFSYQFNTNFKTIISTTLNTQKNDFQYGGEQTLNSKISAEIKYNLLKKGLFSVQLNSIQNRFEGNNNSSVSYEMLDGLQPGTNTTWSVSFQRTISNGIQLNLTYEGRKSADVKTIHTGGMQVRAFF